jgi:uncharacterized membrane protein
MKSKYLEKLKAELMKFQASKDDIHEILMDYGQLYDDALSTGKSDEEVWSMLGDPKEVSYDLIDTLRIKKHKNIRNKLIALSPFISLIVYMVLGFAFELWHPGWLVFLLTPVVAIAFHSSIKEGLIGLSPFISVLTFLFIGFEYNLWHPGWLVFLLIPIASIVLTTKKKDTFVAISPFIALIVFMILGTYYDLWNPGWLVFLIVPMIGILYKPNKWIVLAYELSFLLAIGFYLYMGYVYDMWSMGALGFALPVIMGIIFSDIHFFYDSKLSRANRAKSLKFISIIILSIVTFLLLGILLNGWAYAWQVFLLVPVAAIVLFEKKFHFVAITPFIAVILFFSLGYFFNLFHISWLAFLIIPMAGIIENA